jgi:hypothetical protein
VSHNTRRSPNVPPFDIQGLMEFGDLPRPKWDLVESWIEARVAEENRWEAWLEVQRQWLETLGPELGEGYRAVESDNFLVLIDRPDTSIDRFLEFAETCRKSLEALLPGVADLEVAGKHVVVALNHVNDYHRYIGHDDRRDGASGGMHIRTGLPHVALNAFDLAGATNTLAHELMHVALHHLEMPVWLEEGLAQMFEHDATGRQLLVVDAETAAAHKDYWRRYGLGEFWHGEGFNSGEEVQKLCYELAEITIRLLVENHRPRWFGLSSGKQRQLAEFLNAAKIDDAGAAASEKHLGRPITELPATFLGPGPWSRGLRGNSRTAGRERNDNWSGTT